VTFAKQANADEAAEYWNNQDLMGRTIQVHT
jgi:hypothetical protein